MNPSKKIWEPNYPSRELASFLFLLLLCCLSTPAQAQTLVTNILYQDEFSGGGPLNGWVPDTVDVGTNAWEAGPDWGIDGTEAYEQGGLGCAFLPFTPLPGRVYMLTAALAELNPSGSWTALGFAGTANGTGYFATRLNAVGWVLASPAGDTGNFDQCFIGPNTLGGLEEDGFGGQYALGPTNYTVVLDTRPANPTNWTFTFLNGSSVMRPTQTFGTPAGEPNGPVINYVAIGNGNGGDETIVQNFTLSEITVASQAPYIITPPQPPPAGTNFPGDYVTLSVGAGGFPGPYYQWRFDSNVISGATNSSFVLPNLSLANAGFYQVVVSNNAGSVTSAPVAVHVATPLTNIIYEDTFSTGTGGLLAGRTPDTVDLGTNAWVASTSWMIANNDGTNEAVASGDGGGPNAFLPFVPVPGQVYTLSATLDDQAGGSGWLALGYANADPTEGSFNQGSSVGWILARDDGDPTANQAFEGPGTDGGQNLNDYSTGPATYTTILDTRAAQPSQWTFSFQVNGVTVLPPTAVGGSGPTISFVGIGGYDADSFTAQNLTLMALSEPIKPYFTVPPQSGVYYVGETAVLSSTGGGALPLTYQWEHNSSIIPGATNSSLTLTNLTLANGGSYQLQVSNPLGATLSPAAVLSVSNAPTALTLSSNLVLHLKFDTNYLDYSGRGNNATSVGSTIVPGIVGSGAMTYGNNGSANDLGYATLGTPPDLLFSNSVSFSVSYWIQYTNVSDNEQNGSYPPYAFPSCDLPIIGNAVGSTYSPGWVIAQGGESCEGNAGAFIWTLNDTSATTVAAAGPAHSEDDGNWHHLVHIFDRTAGLGTTYLDGLEVNSTDISTIGNIDNVSPTNNVNIGQDPTGAYFSAGAANLDDLSIWRRALTGNEARALYEAGLNNHVGVATQPLPLTTTHTGLQVTVTWSAGILQSAPSLTGPWTAVTNAVTPTYTTKATTTMQYFRAIQ